MNADSLEFYKNLYEIENDRKKEINNNINIGFTIITLMGTIVAFIIKNLFNTNFGYLIIPIFVLVLIDIFLFFRTHFMNKYQYIKLATEVKKEFEKIDTYYEDEFFKNIDEKELENLKQKDKDESLKDFYINYATENKTTNDSRIQKHNIFIIFVLISILFLGIIGIIAICNEKPQDIYISNPNKEIVKGGTEQWQMEKK